MKNTKIDREIIKKVATALDEINDRVVYVGGAIASFYANDPIADTFRPTMDIDFVLEITSASELEQLRQDLNKKGFKNTAKNKIACRFSFEDVFVDVLATKDISWATGNQWFEKGFNFAIPLQIDQIQIRILPVVYFLASKFDAFNDRGIKQVRFSKDFEDIVFILNYCSYFKNEFLNSQNDVVSYLKKQFKIILDSDSLQEVLLGHIYYEFQEKRFQKIINLLRELTL